MTSLKSIIPARIRTTRLLLELFDHSPEHYDCLLRSLNSKSAHANMGDFGIRTPEGLDKLFSTGNLQPSAFTRKDLILDTKIIYIIREGNEQGPLIGGLSLAQRTVHVPPDLGYMIEDDFQRKGYATEAAKALLDMLLNTAGIPRIMVWPGAKNEPSIKVAQRMGLVEGPKQKDKDGNDLLVYVLPGMEMEAGNTLSVGGDA